MNHGDRFTEIEAGICSTEEYDHINCTMKSITPDSINIDRTGRRLFFPLPLVARDALAILNTSKPVNMAFTTRDKETDRLVLMKWLHLKLASVECAVTFRLTYPEMLVLEWKEWLLRAFDDTILPNNDISECDVCMSGGIRTGPKWEI